MLSIREPHKFLEFSTQGEWTRAIAGRLVRDLNSCLASGGDVGVILAGGRTPAPIYGELVAKDLPWSRIHVCPTDERWVPPDHADSNERSIRSNLVDHGAGFRLHSLYRKAGRPSEAVEEVERSIASMPRPFCAVLLGMGEDGHFASLFPGVTETGTALDPECNRLCVGIDSPQNGHPRMSLTLRALTDATHVYVAITGAEKRAILVAANEAKDTSIPISAMLAQSMAPLEIFWTP